MRPGVPPTVIVLALLALLTGCGSGDREAGKDGAQDAAKRRSATSAVVQQFSGIPQQGITLGDPQAPVTIIVFADPQCPYCRDFDREELPRIIDEQVKTGKAKLSLRMRAFLNDDSAASARAIYAAAQQNKAFEVMSLIFHSQGDEARPGWADERYLNGIFQAVPGLDVAKAKQDSEGERPKQLLAEAETLARRYGSAQTPELFIGPSEADAKLVDGLSPAEVARQVRRLSK